jgi:hypothetical protein
MHFQTRASQRLLRGRHFSKERFASSPLAVLWLVGLEFNPQTQTPNSLIASFVLEGYGIVFKYAETGCQPVINTKKVYILKNSNKGEE